MYVLLHFLPVIAGRDIVISSEAISHKSMSDIIKMLISSVVFSHVIRPSVIIVKGEGVMPSVTFSHMIRP